MVDVIVEAKRTASYAWLVVVVAGVVIYCLWGYDAPSFKCQYYIMLCYVMLHSYLLTGCSKLCGGYGAPAIIQIPYTDMSGGGGGGGSVEG